MGENTQNNTEIKKEKEIGAFKRLGAWLAFHKAIAIILAVLLVVGVGGGIVLGKLLATKTVEIEGEVLLLQGESYTGGLNVKATTGAGLIHREEVRPENISGFDPNLAGEQEVTVSYRGWNVGAKIKVLAPSEVTVTVREGTLPTEFEPNDPFPQKGVFDIYYEGKRIRSAPILPSSVSDFTTRLSGEYESALTYREGFSVSPATYRYTVLEVIESITPKGVLYVPQGVALSKENAVGNLRFIVKYKDGTESSVMLYDQSVTLKSAVLEESEAEYSSTLQFYCMGQEIPCTVTAYPGEFLSSKSVTLHCGKTVYLVGETFDYASAYLEVLYERFGDSSVMLLATEQTVFLAELQNDGTSDGSTLVLISDGSEPILFDEVKNCLLVAYDGLNYSLPVLIRVISGEDAAKVTDLTTTWRGGKSGPPVKGEELDFTEGVLIVEYGYGYRTKEVPLTADMVSGYDSTVAGDQEITLTYDTFVKVLTIRVGDPTYKEVTKIIGVGEWTESTKYSSQTVVVPPNAYLEVEVGYGAFENQKVYLKDNPDVTYTGFTPQLMEKQEVTIWYKGLSISISLILSDDRTETIQNFFAPVEISIKKGEVLDLSGQCTVVYSTDRQEEMTLEEVLTAGGRMEGTYDVNVEDEYKVWIYYPGFDDTDHFTWIRVKDEAAIKAVTIKLEAKKDAYTLNEQLDLDTMTLSFVYTNGETEDISNLLEEVMFFNFDTTRVGSRTAIATLIADEGTFVTYFNYTVE